MGGDGGEGTGVEPIETETGACVRCTLGLTARLAAFYPRGMAPRDLRARLTRHADLALAALVVGAVGMMIVPLPAFLLDLLISLNLAVAVTLLLIAIYVSDALKI